ncbi:MAG: hypothetical protein ACXV8Q_11535, partial [Methylobacter sp.]
MASERRAYNRSSKIVPGAYALCYAFFHHNTGLHEIHEETDMGLALKDTQHHCYGDYLTWPD